MANPLRWWRRRNGANEQLSASAARPTSGTSSDSTAPGNADGQPVEGVETGNYLQRATAQRRAREQRLAAERYEADIGTLSTALLNAYQRRLPDDSEWSGVQRAVEALRSTPRNDYDEHTRDHLRSWAMTQWRHEAAWNFALILYERPMLAIGGSVAMIACVASALQAAARSWFA